MGGSTLAKKKVPKSWIIIMALGVKLKIGSQNILVNVLVIALLNTQNSLALKEKLFGGHQIEIA